MQIVCKPAAAVMETLAEALLTSLRLGLLVVIEPKAFSLVAMQLQRILSAAAPLASVSTCGEELRGVSGSWPGGADSGVDRSSPDAVPGADTVLADTPSGSSAPLPPADSWGGSAAVLTQAQLLAQLSCGNATAALIAERGRLGAKTDAAQEAGAMADALFVGLQARVAEICRLLDADVGAAAAGMQQAEEFLAQVRAARRPLAKCLEHPV